MKKNKQTVQLNIRITEEEKDLFDKFYITAMSKRSKIISKAAFIREQLIKLSNKK